jgi:nicotinate-nucleotide pyrophosphorylase (carboxylating)
MIALRTEDILPIAAQALHEDIGAGDITTLSTIPEGTMATVHLVAREAMILAGLPIAHAVFRLLNADIQNRFFYQDGQQIPPGHIIATLTGQARSLLTAERTALNYLQLLSGIATLTSDYVKGLAGTGCRLLDTRKTTPALRLFSKYAARMGGAVNHRLRLDDGILIKDNHIALGGGLVPVLQQARMAFPDQKIIVECDTIPQVTEALTHGADWLLLDNMTLDQLREAVALNAGQVPLEASGGVNLSTIRAIAQTGVNYVSVGRITQSAPAVDIGVDIASLT